MKKPRLTERDRLEIELGLKAGKTPYAIAKELGRPAKTATPEIFDETSAGNDLSDPKSGFVLVWIHPVVGRSAGIGREKRTERNVLVCRRGNDRRHRRKDECHDREGG